jgi:hypothetical protein
MRDIFAKAQVVTALLGNLSDDSDFALTLVQILDVVINDLFRIKKPVSYENLIRPPRCEYHSENWAAL